MLYRLGGNYFDKGRYHQSNAIDEQFLKFWPNHLDVLFRHAYAMHKLGQNDSALKLSSKLEKLEPSGLYNSFIVKMFVYSSSNKTTQFEETFNELLAQPEEFLKLNDDTYRFLVFFLIRIKNFAKEYRISLPKICSVPWLSLRSNQQHCNILFQFRGTMIILLSMLI